jgi:hypothetical protein
MAVRTRGGGDFGSSHGITVLVLDRAAIARMNFPGGMTYTWARNLGLEIALRARSSLLPGRGYRTGELQRSVGSSVTPTAGSVVMNVRATASHALYYHEGTAPHRIARNAPLIRDSNGRIVSGVLRYRKFRELGGYSFAPEVMHPGYGGHPFLTDAMDQVLLFRGISV